MEGIVLKVLQENEKDQEVKGRRKLTQGTWCSTCPHGGTEGIPAESCTFHKDCLLSKRHSPLYSSHSYHCLLRAMCLRDRRRCRPEPIDMHLKPREEGRSGGYHITALTVHTPMQRTDTCNSFFNCSKDPSICKAYFRLGKMC